MKRRLVRAVDVFIRTRQALGVLALLLIVFSYIVWG